MKHEKISLTETEVDELQQGESVILLVGEYRIELYKDNEVVEIPRTEDEERFYATPHKILPTIELE